MAAITPLVGPSNRQRRRGLVGLVAATAIGSTGLAAGGTAGPLLAADLTGSQAAAGLPLGVLVMGSAVAALLISRGTTRIGRGRALMAGYGAGAVGAGLVVLAAAMGSIVALIVGSCILGSANAAIFLTRYAAAEIGGEAERGRALGTVLFATTLGAVASPSLLGPSASLAKAAGMPPLSGLYMVAFVSFAVAALVLGGASAVRAPFLGLAAPLFATRGNTITIDRGEVRTALRARATRNALVILALTNLVMVAVMAIAPVDMRSHGHDLQLVGVAISTHVAGMFAPSPVSGWVADRVGARAVAAAGLALLLSSGLAGAMVNLGDAASTIAVLAVLGLDGIWESWVAARSLWGPSRNPCARTLRASGRGRWALQPRPGLPRPVSLPPPEASRPSGSPGSSSRPLAWPPFGQQLALTWCPRTPCVRQIGVRWSRREAARDTDRADLSVPLLAIGVLLIGHVLILFFDLVLVFTHTQLTSLLAHDRSVESMARVVLVFIVLFWMYGAFA